MTEIQPRRLQDFEPLTPAEQKVLDELDTGELIVIGKDVPDADAGEDRLIRARFLRWVILTNGAPFSDNGWPKPHTYRVHEKGVQICGALIDRELDLEGKRVNCDLVLVRCKLNAQPNLDGSHLSALYLMGCTVPGLSARWIKTDRNLSLSNSIFEGTVLLVAADIGDSLNCTGAKINGDNNRALIADRLRAGGGVNLYEATMIGSVRLNGARIGDFLNLQRAELLNRGGKALDATSAQFQDVFFVVSSGEKAFKLDGQFDLSAAKVHAIRDIEAWSVFEGSLVLNGFEFNFFKDDNIKPDAIIKWLGLQYFGKRQPEFWPQPYEQCAKVLREMGHQDDAREILIEKERRQREFRRNREGKWMARAMSVRDRFLGWSVCYGQKPLRAAWWLVGLWLFGTLAFWGTHAVDQFKPNNAFVLRSAEWVRCGVDTNSVVTLAAPDADDTARTVRGLRSGETQLTCFERQPEGLGFPAFDAAVYSFDVLFPLVQLEQQVHWVPDEDQWAGLLAKWLVYVQIVMGWLLSLLAVAGLSGIIKSD